MSSFVPRLARLSLLAAACMALAPADTQAANLYWDANGANAGVGGTGSWDTTSAFWSSGVAGLDAAPVGAFTDADQAYFAGTSGVVTLAAPSTIGGLVFVGDGFQLAGATLTLASADPQVAPEIFVGRALLAELAVSLAGTDGFTKTGVGSLRLTAAGTYAGLTTIANGSLILTRGDALGADASVVTILGSATRGTSGGQLVLAGGVTLARDLSLRGLGPIADRSGTVVSVGDNILAGAVAGAVGLMNNRLIADGGVLTLAGSLDIAGTAGSQFVTFGGVNAKGNGNYALTGVLTGTGSLNKESGGTLLLRAADATGFSGVIRASGGTIRVEDVAVLGARASGGTGGVLDFNGGAVELRLDAPGFGSTRNVYHRGSSTASSFFADQAVGGYGVINGVVGFGQFAFEENLSFVFGGRNGFGYAFTSAPVQGGTNNSTITSNAPGTVVFNGNTWSNTDNGAARTMTINGAGNVTLAGNLVASSSSFDHNLTKAGASLLRIVGTGSTLDGNVSINDGALAITDFRSVNNNGARINIGNSTAQGRLIIGETGGAPSAAGLVTNKVVNLAGTTGGAQVFASQPGANPVVFNAAFLATGVGAKTLAFSGTNTAENLVAGAIVENGGAVSLQKNGPGTWALAGANAFTGGTLITNGTLRLKDTYAAGASRNLMPDAAAFTFQGLTATQDAAGTLEYVGAAGSPSVEVLGNLSLTAGAATIRVSPGLGGTAALEFSGLSTNANATLNVVAGPGASVKMGTLTGFGAQRIYFNGADIGIFDAGVVRAPVYGTDTDFNAVNVLSTGKHGYLTADASSGAITQKTLKLEGSVTLTLSGTLSMNNGTNQNGNILATGGASRLTGANVSGPGSANLSLRVNQSSDVLTIDGSLTGFTAGINKNGEGRLVLNGSANAFTGTVNLNEGVIELGAGARLGGDGVTTFSSLSLRQWGVLDLGGNPVGFNSFNGSGVVTNGAAGAATFIVGNNAGSGTWTGAFQDGVGVLNVVKTGTAGQNWHGVSTHTGFTRIGGSALVDVQVMADIGQPSGLGAGSAGANAASLVFDGTTGGLNYAGSARILALTFGSASVSTDRLFTLAGAGATLSSTVSNGNAIVWRNPGDIAFGVVGPQTLVLTGTSTGDNALFPRLTDSGTGADLTAVTKTGTGVWVLGNFANAYSGITTVGNGTLVLAAAGALPASSPLVLGNAATAGIVQAEGSFVRSLAATAVAGVESVTWAGTAGGGFAAAGSSLVVALGGVGSPTALTWGQGGFVPTGAALQLSSTVALGVVDFRNPIDVDGAARTITVNDNTTTFTDYAVLSGVISNSGGSPAGLAKAGSGVLVLAGANTYDGTTTVSAGQLMVASLGQSGAAGSSALGATLGAHLDASALLLGNGGTGAGILHYVGQGEVTDRKVRLNTTTGSTEIHASGAGPLVLTNLANDLVGGAKSLYLRGSNAGGNAVTGVLADNGGALAVVIDGAASWILDNPLNTLTGNITANGGALGVGADAALGTGGLVLGSASVFAFGGDRVLANIPQISNNTGVAFVGDHAFTFTQPLALRASANSVGLTNNLPAGKPLVFPAVTVNDIDANGRAWNIGGSGDTVVSGDITTTKTFAFVINYSGTGSLTLGGTGSNTNGGALNVTNGTLRLGADGVLANLLAGLSLVTPINLTLNPAAGVTATLDLNGRSDTLRGLTAAAGTAVLANSSGNAAQLTFGAGDQNFALNGAVTNAGAGAFTLRKVGAGTATFAGGTYAHQGATLAEGGILTFNGPVTATNALAATGGARLALPGGLTQPALVTALTVGPGATLGLAGDNVGSDFAALTALSLGTGAGIGTATLALNIGDVAAPGDGGNTDTLRLLTGGALALGGTVTFNLSDAGLNANQTYTLLTLADGGLTAFGAGNILQGATPGGFTSFTWDVTDAAVRITTGNLITGVSYWRGLSGTAWNGAADNWSQDKAGATPAVSIPGQGTDVRFQWDAGSAAAVVTTLEQNFKVNSLVFEPATVLAQTPVSVDIGPGAVATSRLEIAPQSATDGVAILAGGPATVTVSAGFKIGAAQTWTLADAASVLSLGALQGAGDITKAGAGRVVLTAAAEPSFNLAATTDFLVTGGALELRSGTALGSALLANLATVRVDAGAFYVNAAATTLANPLILAGGVLSAGTATQTYSGAVSLLAASTVNLRDNASAVLTTAARNVTLTGGVTGPGRLTVDSVNTLSNLNQLSGTLSVNNVENPAWAGGLDILRGTVATNRETGFGTGPISLAAGKVVWSGVNTATWTVPNDLTIAAASGPAYGEINVDNASGTVAAPFTVNFTGALTLGGAGGPAEARVYLADAANTVANFTGPITLADNGALNFFAGGSVVTLDAVIGETGGARSLALNPAGWTTTSAVLRLRGANTFSGNLSLGAGLTAEFATVSDVGGPASNLGRGAAITLAGGTLAFTGGASQSTDRGLTAAANANLRLAGDPSATMTYAGAFNAAGFSVFLTAADGTLQGSLLGGLTQTGTGADLYVNSGRWTLGGATSTIADDIVVTGADARLILAGTGSLAYVTGTSNGLYARNGGTITLASDHVAGAANEGGLDFILLGDTTPGAVGTLELAGFDLISPRLDLGNRAAGLEGVVAGPGLLTLTTASANWSSGVRLLRGTVSADLAGGASFFKFGPGTVVLSGANAGLTNTTVATRLDEGELRLDFAASGAAKLPTGANLDLRGGTLALQAGAGPGAQAFAGLVLTTGHSRLDLRAAAGESLLLDFAGITRSANAGTVRLFGPAGGLSADRGFATTAADGLTGALGAHLTLSLGGESWFVRNDGGRIAPVASVVSDDLTAWAAGTHVTDGVGGFAGQAASVRLASLRFGAASGSVATLAAGAELVLADGGLLVSEGVTAGAPALQGGSLRSATGELILTQHSAQPFELGSTLLPGTTLTKAGEGVLVLSGANRNGAVQLQSGVLRLAGGNALEDATLVTLAGNQPSTLQLLANETLGRLAGGSATTDSVFGLVDIGNKVLTLRPTASATYSGQLTGAGTIVKNGLVGEMTFNGISSGFTGLLRISQAGVALSGVGAINATRIEVNGAGFLLINNNGTTRSGTRIPDSTPLVLNSAAGTRFNETSIRGVWITTDQNATSNEIIGNLIFGSGASYLSGNASGTTGVASLLAADFIRQNGATAIVRGRALGATSGDRNVFRINDATADAAFVARLTGGLGAAATATMSIVPWMVGETLSAGYAETNMGNSLMTYVAGQALRPLSLTTEYASYATAGATNNTRESLTTSLTSLAGRTVNSLSLHAANAAATTYAFGGTGASQSLTNASGAFLFTLNPAATAGGVSRINLGGFDDGLLVGGSEYVFHVQNPSTVTGAATLVVGVASPLASAADLTKSGRGTLILEGTNLAGGGARRTVLNEGVLEIADLDAIGGDTGALIFAGGTLRFGAGFADDLFGRTIAILEGGMGLDTNGVNQTITTALGTGVGRIAKYGLGDLTLDAAVSNGGPVLVAGGKLVFGVPGALANGWDLQLGEGVTTGSLDLGSSDFTVTALSALANNASASVLTVAPGRVLRVEGDIVLSNRTDAGRTLLTIEGGGGLVVQAASIVVGLNAAGNNFSSSAFLDLSGLASFSAELSTRLAINAQSDNSAADFGVLTLSAGPNFISAPSILIGASGAGSLTNALRLGPSTNILRTDLLYLGSGNRDSGRLEFQAAGGTLSLRNLAGDGRAQVTLGNSAAQTTGYGMNNALELEGRAVDLAIGTYATSPFARSGANVHDFRFDTGLVDILQVNLAIAKGTGASTSLLRIGGGELRLGGSAAFGDAGTGSVSLGAAGAGELRIDGGLVVTTVPIGRSAGAGSATLTLSGGVLDLGGNDLGSAALPLTLALSSGTLRDYGQLNGGQALVKTGAGTLILEGTSGHVAGITISAGTLQVGAGGATGTLGNSDVANAGTLAFDRTGTLVVSGTITGSGGLLKDGAGTVVLTADNVLGGAATLRSGVLQLGAGGTTGDLLASGLTLDAGATLRFDRSDALGFDTPLAGAIGSTVVQAGSGRTRLTATSLAFAGDVQVTAGELELDGINVLSGARQILVSQTGTLRISSDDTLGYGSGPDVVLDGGVMSFLSSLGADTSSFAPVRDLTLNGGTVSSGTADSSYLISMVVKGRIDVTDDTAVTARQVALIFGGTASVATEVSVAAGKTLSLTGSLADDQLALLPTAFDKQGAGTLVLSGDNTRMTGASSVTAGVVDVRHVNALGNGLASNPVTFQVAQTTVVGGSLVINQANFGATGAVAGAIIISNGGSIGVAAPGSAIIGNLRTSNLKLNGGALIEFKVWDINQAAGIGYDKLDLGAIDLSGATSADRIKIKLISMNTATSFGSAVNLNLPTDPANFGSFDFGSYTSSAGVSGNISDLFTFDTSQFAYTGGTGSDAGLWAIDFNATNGAITLTAVPEPSTYGFGLGALALAAAAIRRRRQTKKA